jgi:hypothetical protein
MLLQNAMCARCAAEMEHGGDLAAETETDSAPPRLARDGEVWVLSHRGRRLRFKHSKGIAYLAVLLDEPRREFFVGDLIGGGRDAAVITEREARHGGLGLAFGGDAGELLDASARAAYRRRLAELHEALDDAELRREPASIARLRAEREALADELARAVGLGGRSRRAGSAAERARINVQRRIRDALTRIAGVDPPLGRYLSRRVRTGTFCAFEP